MSSLLQKLSDWRPFTAVVVGDMMLDEMVYGNIDRLCNDAPVPVMAVDRTEQRPGGAANVCAALAALRGRVRAVGVVGADSAGQHLRARLEEAGVEAAGLVVDGSRPTTVKRSLVGLAQHRHAQKVLRMDYESRRPVSPEVERGIESALARALHGADVVCLEDYHKGVCTPGVCAAVIRAAGQRGVPVLVDPAAIADYARYRGATCITPNRGEAERAVGERLAAARERQSPEDYADVAERLVEDLDLEAAVITLDRQGALLLTRRAEAMAVPTVARRVYDVTGAGDMVLAALAAARANGLDWFDAVRFANAAAGLSVEEVGAVAIPLERVHRDLLQRERATRGKVRTREELAVELAALRQASPRPRVVLANGCFDVLHAGHVSLLRRAAELGDYLVVATNDDAGIRRLKGPDRPVYPEEDRVQLLGALEFVDAVTVFTEDTPEVLIRALRPDVLVKGAQYDRATIPGAAFVESIGGRVELLPVVDGRSTTGTVRRIRGAEAPGPAQAGGSR
jgi:D-beta-D-heptose 7-phosphate kinase/D-beta-D-heptose 1-phosphate adenosyltransferase